VLSGNVTADKLLPQMLGLAVPVSMNYTESRARPKYLPGRDIEVTNNLSEEVLESIDSFNRQYGINFSIRRRVKSQNFFVKNTIDNLSGSLSYTNSNLSNSQMLYSDRIAWSGDANYNLTFGQKNFLKPFGWIGRAPLLGKLSATKLYFTPQNIGAQLQATNSKSASQTRIVDSKTNVTIDSLGVLSRISSYTAVYGVRTSMKVIDPLTMDFSRTHTADLLSKARRDSSRTDGLAGLLNGNYDLVNAGQSFSLRYNPNLFNWLVNNFNYTSNYRFTNNIQQQQVGRNTGTNVSFTASTTLRLAQMFEPLTRRKSTTTPPRAVGETRQPPRPAPDQKPPRPEPGAGEEKDEPEKEGGQAERKPQEEPSKEEQPKQGEQKKKDEARGAGISPLDLVRLFTKLKDITVSFSRTRNYANNSLKEGTPSLRYQFGLTGNPEVDQVQGLTTLPSSFVGTINYSAQTGVDITRYLNLTLRFEHNESRNENTTISGTSSDSWMRTENLGLPFLPEVDIPFPEWTLNWNGLERIKLFGFFATNMGLSHGFGGKRSSIWSGQDDRVTSEDFSFNFRPLIKVNVSWKNGMISAFQYNKTTGERPTYLPYKSDPNHIESATLTRNSDMSFTTTYSKRSGFRIPLPFLRNKELKNSVDLSLTFSKNSSTSALKRTGGAESNANETKRWTLEPRMTYSFSNRVRGGAFFIFGKTESKLSGTTDIKELGVDVNISIRGE
jgi:hypothetical protein